MEFMHQSQSVLLIADPVAMLRLGRVLNETNAKIESEKLG